MAENATDEGTLLIEDDLRKKAQEIQKRDLEAASNLEASRRGYRAEQGPDGTWTVRDVPIFAAHVDKRFGDEIDFSRGWLVNALERFAAREDEGYLPPLHVRHHAICGGKVERAGHFKPTKVASMRYDGKPHDVVFADFVKVPDAVYERLKSGEFPYRSVEIHDYNVAEIDSLALLDHDVPYFRFPIFSVAEERAGGVQFSAGRLTHELAALYNAADKKDAETARFVALHDSPALFYRAFDARGASILLRFADHDSDGVPDKGREAPADKKPTDGESEGGKEGKDLDAAKAAAIEAVNKFRETVERVTARIDEVAKDLGCCPEGAAAADQNQEAQQTMVEKKPESPMPAEQPQAQKPPVKKADALAVPFTGTLNHGGTPATAALLGELAALKARVDVLEGEKKNDAIVKRGLQDLAKRGFKAQAVEEDLRRAVDQGGEDAARIFIDAAAKHGVPEPPASIEQATRPPASPEVAKYGDKGPAGLELATRYSAMYDAMPASTRREIKREDYIRVQMEADARPKAAAKD